MAVALTFALSILGLLLVPSQAAVTGTTNLTGNSSNCGTIEQRLACIQHSFPVFSPPDCDKWTCSHVSTGQHHFPFKCCMFPLSVAHSYHLLHDAALVFVGDSTSRRAARQTAAFLQGIAFDDPLPHHEPFKVLAQHHRNFSGDGEVMQAQAGVATPTGTGAGSGLLNVTVASIWRPMVDELIKDLRNGIAAPITLALAGNASVGSLHQAIAEHATQRKVFVLSYSIHDLYPSWAKEKLAAKVDQSGAEHYPDDAMLRLVRRTVEGVTLLKKSPHVAPSRDIVLVRLPIAETCGGSKFNGTEFINQCEPAQVKDRDPINEQLARMHKALQAAMEQEHPDVGLLDLMSWTWAKSGVGRSECTIADEGGTHFGTDAARQAFVQQVLNAVQLMAEERPHWPQRKSLDGNCPASASV